jgi:hypothetical protein
MRSFPSGAWVRNQPTARRRPQGQRVGPHGVCVEHFLLSPALVANLRASGLSVTTGTVNHAAILTPPLPLSLDAITSDAPHGLRHATNRARETLPIAD